MVYARAFFDLQFAFAERVATLSGLRLSDALLQYTNFYIRFGFLDRHGSIKQSMGDQFLERLAQQSSLENLDQCFPLPVLTVEAPVQEFYAFYGV